jgi:hypothetical protein
MTQMYPATCQTGEIIENNSLESIHLVAQKELEYEAKQDRTHNCYEQK